MLRLESGLSQKPTGTKENPFASMASKDLPDFYTCVNKIFTWPCTVYRGIHTVANLGIHRFITSRCFGLLQLPGHIKNALHVIHVTISSGPCMSSSISLQHSYLSVTKSKVRTIVDRNFNEGWKERYQVVLYFISFFCFFFAVLSRTKEYLIHTSVAGIMIKKTRQSLERNPAYGWPKLTAQPPGWGGSRVIGSLCCTGRLTISAMEAWAVFPSKTPNKYLHKNHWHVDNSTWETVYTLWPGQKSSPLWVDYCINRI